MPKRMVDGDKLWRSDKLGHVEPENFRGEYANLLPLALANGSFECSSRRIWGDVYFYNRPSFEESWVAHLLNELERVKLLFRWKEPDGKIWGFWIGITSEGLLPAKAHVDRGDYKKGKEPPQDLLDQFIKGDIPSGLNEPPVVTLCYPQLTPSLPPVGFGKDRLGKDGVGTGISVSNSNEENEQEEEVKAVKEIPVICQQMLGVKAEMWPSQTEDIKALEKIYKGSAVVNMFVEWCQSGEGDGTAKPIAEFLKVAGAMLAGTLSLRETPEATHLVRELAYRSNNEVIFTSKEKGALAKQLKSSTMEEIVSAFREYMAIIEGDDFKKRNASRLFVDGMDQLIYTDRRKKAEKAQEATAVAAAAERMVNEAQKEREARLEALAREQDAVEDELPD